MQLIPIDKGIVAALLPKLFLLPLNVFSPIWLPLWNFLNETLLCMYTECCSAFSKSTGSCTCTSTLYPKMCSDIGHISWPDLAVVTWQLCPSWLAAQPQQLPVLLLFAAYQSEVMQHGIKFIVSPYLVFPTIAQGSLDLPTWWHQSHVITGPFWLFQCLTCLFYTVNKYGSTVYFLK